jgi:hypothetical protein
MTTLTIAALTMTFGCSDSDTAPEDGTGEAEPEIVGSYVDSFMGTHEVTADTWTMAGMGVFHIETWNNDADYLVAQNDTMNEFNPDLWSRMDWTEADGQLYFCQSVFDAETAEAAEMAEGADASDLTAGCAGFEWTQLTAQ